MSAIGKSAPFSKIASTDHYDDTADQALITAIAAHELREPTQAILSFLCVLLEERAGPLNAVQQDFLATADQAARRLKRRIDDLQLVMTGDAGLTVEGKEVNLLTRIEECCNELSLIAQSYDVTLSVKNDAPALEPLIWADPDRVDQVLLNLIENAIQYSSRGSTVQVVLCNCMVDGWCVVVENNVSQPLRENPSRWFIPHIRGDHGRTMRPDGQGLGLVAADILVRAHGGRISAMTEGNTVSISAVFPCCQTVVSSSISSIDWSGPWVAS